MRVTYWTPLLLTLAVAVPSAAQDASARQCRPAISEDARNALRTSIRDSLRTELGDAARAAGIVEPVGIVFADMRRRGAEARVWSYDSNLPDSLSRRVIARRADLLACWPERRTFVYVRLDPGVPTGSTVEHVPSVQNPTVFQRAIERISRTADPSNRTRGVTVQLRMLVTRDGEVAFAELLYSTTNLDVDRAVLDAARELRFRPARVGDTAVDVWVEQPVLVRTGR